MRNRSERVFMKRTEATQGILTIAMGIKRAGMIII